MLDTIPHLFLQHDRKIHKIIKIEITKYTLDLELSRIKGVVESVANIPNCTPRFEKIGNLRIMKSSIYYIFLNDSGNEKGPVSPRPWRKITVPVGFSVVDGSTDTWSLFFAFSSQLCTNRSIFALITAIHQKTSIISKSKLYWNRRQRNGAHRDPAAGGGRASSWHQMEPLASLRGDQIVPRDRDESIHEARAEFAKR